MKNKGRGYVVEFLTCFAAESRVKYRKGAVFREIYGRAINDICGADTIPKEPRDALVYFAPRASIAIFDQGGIEDITRGGILRVHVVFDGQLTA